ncbi:MULTISPECIES: hypothetical protein [Streptomyces]|uniref:hypothetical protein n=1 Tax=Streptomyces TaxID=1883 RepID=UPI00163D2FF4|nr:MULTISPECIES: hypothetical protein [Streptomyces]MBC2879804.1 hypothetical protein [Streptomyces sp. TYQ1024]UBI41410.1 hypothetical protein K7I03_33640 [Streptomyces mobaraensis]
MQRYEAEVTVQTADGRAITYRGDGIGPDGVSTEELLNGAEAAALAQEPGGAVTKSRVRRSAP